MIRRSAVFFCACVLLPHQTAMAVWNREERYMKYIKYFKRLLGFDSPYSWTKWVRISLAIVAFYIAEAFLSNFLIPLTSMLGIFGMIIAAEIGRAHV